MAQELTPKGPGKTPSRFAGSFEDFRSEVDRLFDSFFGGFLSPRMAGMGMTMVAPVVDVKEDDKRILVEAELPGLNEKDVELTIRDHYLTISGEKKSETEEVEGSYHVKERRYGSFQRVLRLPESVDESKIEAVVDNGVLRVTLPKKPEAMGEQKKIAIKAGNMGK